MCSHVFARSVHEGDRSDIAIGGGPATCSRITTQAATKIHKMTTGNAPED